MNKPIQNKRASNPKKKNIAKHGQIRGQIKFMVLQVSKSYSCLGVLGQSNLV